MKLKRVLSMIVMVLVGLMLFTTVPQAVELSPPQMAVLTQTTGYIYVNLPASDNNDDANFYVMGLGSDDPPTEVNGSCTVMLSNGCEATFTLVQGRVNLVAMEYFPDGTGASQTHGYYAIAPWLDFDGDGAPPGLSSNDYMPSRWAGINWGTTTNSRWRFTGAYGVNSTNGVYFDSSTGTSRVLTFAYGPATFDTLRFYRETNGAINYTVSNGSDTNASGSCTSSCLVNTGFTTATTSVTVTITQGWDVGVDDIRYRVGNGDGNILK